ncbi:MAG: peptidylprolyl isomerase [Actinomycetota bacterium]
MGKAEKRARKKQGHQARKEAEALAAKKRRQRNLNLVLGVLVLLGLAFIAYHFVTKPKSTTVATGSTPTPTLTSTPAASPTPVTSPTPSSATSPSPVASSAASAGTGCSTAKPTETATAVNQSSAPAMTISQSKTYTATVDTSCGVFTMTLDQKDTPNGVNSFVYLAQKGFYNGLTFHRIVNNFAIQGGDPKGDGSGGPGYQVTDKVPSGVSYSPGTVAFANAGTNGGAGSQFFVVPDAPNVASAYSPDYSVLGHVTSGLDTTVSNLNNAPTVDNSQNEKSMPVPTVYIYSITISTS